MIILRWLLKNLGTLLLSFVLAVTVWASAVVTADPNQDGAFQPIIIEQIGLAPDLLLTNEIPELAVMTIKAPRSIWEQLNRQPDAVRAWIDLTGLAAGEHEVKVNTAIALSPIRIQSVEPAIIKIVLEQYTSKSLPIQVNVRGEPPLGYRKGQPQITPEEVTISGPASAVNRVVNASATLDISGSSQSVKASVQVRALDETGSAVGGVVLSPKEISILQPISILGGYKNVAVKVITTGQLAEGYRLTNITVTPPTITVYSSNPQLVNELPGYVETTSVDLTGLSDDTDFNIALQLPEGITLVSEPSVLVQVGVAAIEGSLTLSVPVETLGLPPTLAAMISPISVEIIVSGPLPILDGLTATSFRAVVDLTDLGEGTYQIVPTLDLAPDEVQIQAVLPETVEVIIGIAPTPTPTVPAGLTPTPTRRP